MQSIREPAGFSPKNHFMIHWPLLPLPPTPHRPFLHSILNLNLLFFLQPKPPRDNFQLREQNRVRTLLPCNALQHCQRERGSDPTLPDQQIYALIGSSRRKPHVNVRECGNHWACRSWEDYTDCSYNKGASRRRES